MQALCAWLATAEDSDGGCVLHTLDLGRNELGMRGSLPLPPVAWLLASRLAIAAPCIPRPSLVSVLTANTEAHPPSGCTCAFHKRLSASIAAS